MRSGRTKTRIISLFVLAFLCLNAGGVLCLTYCSQMVAAKADHCPIKKQAADCHRKAKTDAADDLAFYASSVKCYMLPVSVFAAPLENKVNLAADVIPAESVENIGFATAMAVRSRQISEFYYRPPPNDRSFERVRNQVFRI